MITVSTFLQQVEPKFDGWLWADYEAKFFGDDLYIKASTDFSYYHLFDLYVRQAKISTFFRSGLPTFEKRSSLRCMMVR